MFRIAARHVDADHRNSEPFQVGDAFHDRDHVGLFQQLAQSKHPGEGYTFWAEQLVIDNPTTPDGQPTPEDQLTATWTEVPA